MSTPDMSDTELAPPQKRQRTEESAEPAVAVVESRDLWLADGNIVIRGPPEGTPPTRILYKVHMFTLALHSAIFASLFDGPQAAFDAGSDRYQDLPVMDLPDSAQDVRDFLKALYLPQETSRHKPVASLPFKKRWTAFPPPYYGILRLAVKYDAQGIRSIVEPTFKAQWPSRLKDWDRLQRWHSDPHLATIFDGLANSDFVHPDPAKAIRLAFTSQLYDALPLAFYQLSCLIDARAASQPADYKRKALAGLTADEVCDLTLGRADLRHRLLDMIGDDLWSWSADECELSEMTCRTGLLDYLDRGAIAGHQVCDPLAWLLHRKRCMELEEGSDCICKPCLGQAALKLLRLRAEFWKALPDIFNLKRYVSPTWGT